MGRGKLALEFIAKDRSRRTTFEKRKKGLMKKAEEFSILCGVDTCMIIYSADDSSGRAPTVWPQDPEKAKQVIDRYLSEGVDRRRRHAMGLPEFFMTRKRKLDSELAKVRSANWAAKYPVSDDLINGLSQDQLRALLAVLGMKLESAKKRLVAAKESAARNTLGVGVGVGVDPAHMEEFKFNSMVIHSRVPMNMEDVMEPPLDISPLVLGSFLPQLMDSSSVMNNPAMWQLVGGNPSATISSSSSNANNCYYNYSVPVPVDYSRSFPQYPTSIPTQLSRTGPLHQNDQIHGTMAAPENTLFDYTGQGLLGSGSSMASMMTAMMPPPPLPQPPQQQPPMMQYPTMQQGSSNASLFERYDQEAPFHGNNNGGSDDQILFSSSGGHC